MVLITHQPPRAPLLAKDLEKGSVGPGESKTNALNAGNQVEMRIIAQYGKTMLTSKSSNPCVIGRYRGRSILQLTPQFSVMKGGLPGNLQDLPLPHHFREPGQPLFPLAAAQETEIDIPEPRLRADMDRLN
jgi:hypothetical protein